MSVFLNSTPQEDGAIVGGACSVVGSTFAFDAMSYRDPDPERHVQFGAGGQFVGIWDRLGTYLETGDSGFHFRWKFWARGAGTIALTQDTDPSWSTSTLPAASIGNLVVSAGAFTLYHVTADSIDLDAFLGWDGIRLGFDCLSGSVDIETVQLECVPTSGLTGGWADQSPYDMAETAATSRQRTVLSNPEISTAPTPPEAMDTAVAAVLAEDPLGQSGIDASNGDLIVTGGANFARSGWNVGEVDAFGYVSASLAILGVDVSGGSPIPVGVNGVDYIRIPGYTEYDANPYTRSAANRDNLPTSFINWTTPHVWYWRDLGTFHDGPYLDIPLYIKWYFFEDVNLLDDTVGFPYPSGGSAFKTITPADVDEIQLEAITLPSSGTFSFCMVVEMLDGGSAIYPSTISPFGAGVHFASQITLQSDDEAELNTHPPLYYVKHFDAYSVWTPEASSLSWVRWRGRGDGLGLSTYRARGHSTWQASNRVRGIR